MNSQTVGQVIVVVGAPGSGKTTLVSNLSRALENQDLRTQRIYQDSVEPHRLLQRLLIDKIINPAEQKLRSAAAKWYVTRHIRKLFLSAADEIAAARNKVMVTSRPIMFSTLAVDVAQAVQQGNIVILEANPADYKQLQALRAELAEKAGGLIDRGPTAIKIVNLVARPDIALTRVIARNSPQDHRPDDILGVNGQPKYEARLDKEWADGAALGLSVSKDPNVSGLDGLLTVKVEEQTRLELMRIVLAQLDNESGHVVAPTNGQGVNIPEFMINYTKTNTTRALALIEQLEHEQGYAPLAAYLGYLHDKWCAYPSMISPKVMERLDQINVGAFVESGPTAHFGETLPGARNLDDILAAFKRLKIPAAGPDMPGNPQPRAALPRHDGAGG